MIYNFRIYLVFYAVYVGVIFTTLIFGLNKAMGPLQFTFPYFGMMLYFALVFLAVFALGSMICEEIASSFNGGGRKQ